MQTRKASIKETGEELSQAEWERFDAAVAAARKEQALAGRRAAGPVLRDRSAGGAAPAQPTRLPDVGKGLGECLAKGPDGAAPLRS